MNQNQIGFNQERCGAIEQLKKKIFLVLVLLLNVGKALNGSSKHSGLQLLWPLNGELDTERQEVGRPVRSPWLSYR